MRKKYVVFFLNERILQHILTYLFTMFFMLKKIRKRQKYINITVTFLSAHLCLFNALDHKILFVHILNDSLHIQMVFHFY